MGVFSGGKKSKEKCVLAGVKSKRVKCCVQAQKGPRIVRISSEGAVRVRQFPGIRFRVGNRLGGKGEDGGPADGEEAAGEGDGMGAVRGDEAGSTEFGNGTAVVTNDEVAGDEIEFNGLDAIGRRPDADAGTVGFAHRRGIGIEETEARPAERAAVVVVALEEEAGNGLAVGGGRIGNGFGDDPEAGVRSGIGRIESDGGGKAGGGGNDGLARDDLSGERTGPPEAGIGIELVVHIEQTVSPRLRQNLRGPGVPNLGRREYGGSPGLASAQSRTARRPEMKLCSQLSTVLVAAETRPARARRRSRAAARSPSTRQARIAATMSSWW